ncbi:MAG: ribulose-phosphate 3-epimerase, partial [Gemmatimonadetes bacterium]|nr:ribulose-phosphate 3-epimerase [Gemmatimonadota bacterium]
LNPATPLSAVEEVVEGLDLLLIMSVNPGFGGQEFWEPAVNKVARARELLRRAESRALLEVDGGVGRDTIGRLAAAGADTFVAGNAVFTVSDAAAEVRELRRLAEGARSGRGTLV